MILLNSLKKDIMKSDLKWHIWTQNLVHLLISLANIAFFQWIWIWIGVIWTKIIFLRDLKWHIWTLNLVHLLISLVNIAFFQWIWIWIGVIWTKIIFCSEYFLKLCFLDCYKYLSLVPIVNFMMFTKFIFGSKKLFEKWS